MSTPTTAYKRSDLTPELSHELLGEGPAPAPAPASPGSLPLHVAPRALSIMEYGAVFVTAWLAKVIYLELFLNSYAPLGPYAATAAIMGAAVYVVYHQMGLYEIGTLVRPQIGFGRLIGGILIAMLMVLGLLYAIKEISDLSRGWVFAWTALTALVVIVIRLFFVSWLRRSMSSGRLVRRIAVIGADDFVVTLGRRIRETEGLSAAVDLYHCQSTMSDIRFSGGLPELKSRMLARPYDQVIVAIPGREAALIRSVVKELGAFTTELLLRVDMAQLPVATGGSRLLAGVRTDVVHLVPRSEQFGQIKRAFDFTFAATALVLLAPLFLLIAAAIRLESSGPVLFRQRRLGQNCSVFRIYKFRSMTTTDDGAVVRQATPNDNRVTRVGRILRRTSLDELPQLINVLLGDMSLVGPRPHAITHDEEFERMFDLFSRRRRVKPGITGWAQVNGFRGETRTAADVNARMEHDLYYIDNWSIWFDIEIIVRTLLVVPKGAY